MHISALDKMDKFCPLHFCLHNATFALQTYLRRLIMQEIEYLPKFEKLRYKNYFKMPNFIFDKVKIIYYNMIN